jgi:hypothetical protein
MARLTSALGAPEAVSAVSLAKRLAKTTKIAKRADKNAKRALRKAKPGPKCDGRVNDRTVCSVVDHASSRGSYALTTGTTLAAPTDVALRCTASSADGLYQGVGLSAVRIG